MGKHKGRMLYGCAFWIPLFLIAFVGYNAVTAPDKFWNDLFFRPVIQRELPLLGFIITVGIIYLTGALFEIPWGRRLIMIFFGYIPLFGKLIALQGSFSSTLHTLKSGCVCIAFTGETPFRSAAITSIRKTKYDYLVTVAFLGLIPDVRQIKPSATVFAREVIENGHTKYRLYSLATALQLEFGAGITLAENALGDFVEVSLREVLKSEGYINE